MPLKGNSGARLLLLVTACAAVGPLSHADVASSGLNLVRLLSRCWTGRADDVPSFDKATFKQASAGSGAKHKLFRVSFNFQIWAQRVLC